MIPGQAIAWPYSPQVDWVDSVHGRGSNPVKYYTQYLAYLGKRKLVVEKKNKRVWMWFIHGRRYNQNGPLAQGRCQSMADAQRTAVVVARALDKEFL